METLAEKAHYATDKIIEYYKNYYEDEVDMKALAKKIKTALIDEFKEDSESVTYSDLEFAANNIAQSHFSKESYSTYLVDCHKNIHACLQVLNGLIQTERHLVIKRFKEKYNIEEGDLIAYKAYNNRIQEAYVNSIEPGSSNLYQVIDEYPYQRYGVRENLNLDKVRLHVNHRLQSGKPSKKIDWFFHFDEIIKVVAPDGTVKFNSYE